MNTENPKSAVENQRERQERLAAEYKEKQRVYVCSRLLLRDDTTWEQIGGNYSLSLITVLSGETAMGITVQNEEVYKAYRDALVALQSEPKFDAAPYLERARSILEKYDDIQIQTLLALSTVAEAQSSELREVAKRDNVKVYIFYKNLELFTDADEVALNDLDKKRRVLQNAIGALRDGYCTHDDII